MRGDRAVIATPNFLCHVIDQKMLRKTQKEAAPELGS